MKKTIGIVMVLAMTACGEDPPSCQQAVTHYYSVGCSFFDLTTNPPTPYSQNEAITSCKQVNVAVPEQCRDLFDDFMFCMDSAAGQTSAGCDCSQEQDALFACD